MRFAPSRPVPDLEPALGVFHRFIQNGLVEGLIVDVADYRHVHQGPGVLLVGHDVDYGISADGLTVTRKRSSGDDARTQVRDALRMGLAALSAIAYDGALDVSIAPHRFCVSAFDRRIPRHELAAGLRSAVELVVTELYGSDATVMANDDEARRVPQVQVTAPETAGDIVLEKLGGSRAPGQSAWDITVEELARLRADSDDFVLLDVREPNEYETLQIGGKLIALAVLPEHLDDLERGQRIVVHCRSGHRGAKAVALLRESGFDDAWNLNGGLMSWIDRIDRSLPRY